MNKINLVEKTRINILDLSQITTITNYDFYLKNTIKCECIKLQEYEKFTQEKFNTLIDKIKDNSFVKKISLSFNFEH